MNDPKPPTADELFADAHEAVRRARVIHERLSRMEFTAVVAHPATTSVAAFYAGMAMLWNAHVPLSVAVQLIARFYEVADGLQVEQIFQKIQAELEQEEIRRTECVDKKTTLH